jgi:hypothetical protein
VCSYSYQGAVARTRRRGCTLTVEYFGPINFAAVEYLAHQVMPSRRDAVVVLERTDTALTMFYGPVTLNRIIYPDWLPPSAVVVREDQLLRSQELAHLLAHIGVIRVPFLVSQLDWALAFVARVAARRSQAPRHTH